MNRGDTMTEFVGAALLATLFTWCMTALGAATVIFFKTTSPRLLNLMLGFAAGIMIAASFWSLLSPAVERAEGFGSPAWLVCTVGFLCGAVFIWGSDKVVTNARRKFKGENKGIRDRFQRVFLLVLSITLHNIPEGLAVGVAFGAMCRSGFTPEGFWGAVTIAL